MQANELSNALNNDQLFNRLSLKRTDQVIVEI